MSASEPQASSETTGSEDSWKRRLWQRPATVRERRRLVRRVEFLELFFDVVFVVLVAQLAHRLAEHVSWSGVGWFVFLFLTVWSSWLNGTVYHDSHGTNDLSIRVFTFALMLTVAFMAVFAGNVPGDGAAGFAGAYAANSAILALMWFRTGLHDPEHRPSSYPYASAYAVSAVLFALSAFTHSPTIYVLWGVGLALQMAAAIPSMRNWDLDVDGELATPSLVERLGLLVILVLGEVVASAVNGMADHETIDTTVVVVGLLGILVTVGLWWLYFDFVSHRRPLPRLQFVWVYLHFPLVLAIVGAGAAVLFLVEHVGEPLPSSGRWLLVGSIAITLVANIGLTLTLEVRHRHRQLYRSALVATLLSAIVILSVGVTSLEYTATLAVVNGLLLAPIALSALVWLRTGAPDTTQH